MNRIEECVLVSHEDLSMRFADSSLKKTPLAPKGKIITPFEIEQPLLFGNETNMPKKVVSRYERQETGQFGNFPL